jgi:hypothetical protein
MQVFEGLYFSPRRRLPATDIGGTLADLSCDGLSLSLAVKESTVI